LKRTNCEQSVLGLKISALTSKYHSSNIHKSVSRSLGLTVRYNWTHGPQIAGCPENDPSNKLAFLT